MDSSNDSSNVPSRGGTPNPIHKSRFTSQASTAEDLLKNQTVGLVHLSDFRKRRAEALEQKEREASDRSLGRFASGQSSGAATPSDGASTPRSQNKKKKKNPAKGKLSFDVEDEDGSEDFGKKPKQTGGQSEKVGRRTGSSIAEDADNTKRKLGPNASLAMAPKILTKSALLKEAQTRDQLRKEFLLVQEVVKATDFLIPFVFYDGTNTPGGRCKVKKGDHIWLFLDRSRKLGATMDAGKKGERNSSRRDWARIGVDDLMLVRGEIIIPHHYDFYYFIVNKTIGPTSTPLFPYSAQPTSDSGSGGTLGTPGPSNFDPLSRPSTKLADNMVTEQDANLEGGGEDPVFTKVVDRRWYERNKHIFPASVWEEFDPAKDYSKGMRRDARGNSFFF